MNGESLTGCCRPGVITGGDEPPLADGRTGGTSRRAMGKREGGSVCVSVCVCWLAYPRKESRAEGAVGQVL